MKRLVVIAIACILGLGAAVAVAIVGMGIGDTPTRTPQDGRTGGAPELESTDTQDLPNVERSARRFLAGYLAVVYGKPGASVDRIRSASPTLLTRLRTAGARVTPAQAERTPVVERVTVIREGTQGALATAHIKDSPSPAYPLSFHLQNTTDGWLVTRIGGP